MVAVLAVYLRFQLRYIWSWWLGWLAAVLLIRNSFQMAISPCRGLGFSVASGPDRIRSLSDSIEPRLVVDGRMGMGMGIEIGRV